MSDTEQEQLLRAVFDTDTPDDAVRRALAEVLSLDLPAPAAGPVALTTTQALAGYTLGQHSVTDAVCDTVRRVLLGTVSGSVRSEAGGRPVGWRAE